MSERNDNNLESRQRTAQDAVRSLSRPQADAGFRARLKTEFVSGDIVRNAKVMDLPQRRTLRWLGAGLAMAAILALAVIGMNRLPGPQLLATRGQGTVVIDGERHVIEESADLAGLLQPGARVILEGDLRLDVLYPGTMLWRLEPGTDIVMPGRPGRWFGRQSDALVRVGEAALRTGPDLAGGAVAVRTPDGQILVTGTLVNIFCDGELSCFCLYEGTASVQTFLADLGTVPEKMRWVVFTDREREAKRFEIAAPHRDHMLALDAAYPDVFTRR